ncbi:hypothetical protein [Amycolatopsis pigmentata]|uniref:Uncharacterized protein n=1 Tax=Amycolatopsis pigmentata TaxID=450801 RepID=A0ABW5FY02_9PSEU
MPPSPVTEDDDPVGEGREVEVVRDQDRGASGAQCPGTRASATVGSVSSSSMSRAGP